MYDMTCLCSLTWIHQEEQHRGKFNLKKKDESRVTIRKENRGVTCRPNSFWRNGYIYSGRCSLLLVPAVLVNMLHYQWYGYSHIQTITQPCPTLTRGEHTGCGADVIATYTTELIIEFRGEQVRLIMSHELVMPSFRRGRGKVQEPSPSQEDSGWWANISYGVHQRSMITSFHIPEHWRSSFLLEELSTWNVRQLHYQISRVGIVRQRQNASYWYMSFFSGDIVFGFDFSIIGSIYTRFFQQGRHIY